jgi:hypothetical protein
MGEAHPATQENLRHAQNGGKRVQSVRALPVTKVADHTGAGAVARNASTRHSAIVFRGWRLLR